MKKQSEKSQSPTVTMAAVAEKAGVSVASVSNVINRRVAVSDRMRKRVMKAIRQLGYQQNLAAKALKTGISNIIGLIVPTLSNPYCSELTEKIIDIARQRGFIVAVVDTQNSSAKELNSLEFLLQHGVQGIIWQAPRSSPRSIKKHTQGRRVVIVDRHMDQFDSVVPDYEKGAFAIAQYVIGQGHSEIGLINGPQDNYGARLRRNGIRKALNGKARLKWECENRFSETLSIEALEHVFARDVSIIMCGNDLIAVGALLALRSRNISVPDEVSVTGFDNIHMCDLLAPALTSVGVSKLSIAEEAVNLVLDTDRGQRLTKYYVSLGLELVIRDSVMNRPA